MKLNKTLIILSLLLIFCISLSAVSATEDISVNDIDNNVATVGSSAINEEINTVGDEEIHYSSEIFNYIHDVEGTYYIEHDYIMEEPWERIRGNIVIDGQGHTIYGNGHQAFNIKNSMVTIKNLNFIDCMGDNGSAIYIYDDNIVDYHVIRYVVENCSFVGCSANGDGGAIYFKTKECSVVNCSFVNCSANSDGGAIYFKLYGSGDGTLLKDIALSVENSSFVNCSASHDGGAIFYLSGVGSVMACSFVNCSSNSIDAINIPDGIVNYCIFENDNENEDMLVEVIGSIYDDASLNNNFFAFYDKITDFPKNLVLNAVDNWVVLTGYASGDKYIANFVLNDGSALDEFMPDYTARLVVGSEEKIITIHNNTFSCEYDPTKTYRVYSLNTGEVLTVLNRNSDNGSDPVFKPKVILTVDDIKGTSGSTVKVNISVLDFLGRSFNEGTVTISLNGKEYTAKVVNGIATFNIFIPSNEGVYSAKVLFNGEGTRYANTTCDFTVTSVEDNNTGNDKEINKSIVSNKINTMENCGTPLIALLIALISLPLIRRK